MTALPWKVTLQVIDTLQTLGIDYVLVGSLASSALGVPRATIDADLLVALRAEHIEPLARALEADFYVSEHAAREALARHSMFNVIHLATSFKVDLYVPGQEPFALQEMERRTPRRFSDEDPREIYLATPEDLVLSKLRWYELGNRVSERQWRDLVGLLQVRQQGMDREYLQRWSAHLGLEGLLERALVESGSNDLPGGRSG